MIATHGWSHEKKETVESPLPEIIQKGENVAILVSELWEFIAEIL